jgi:hypothetical protein
MTFEAALKLNCPIRRSHWPADEVLNFWPEQQIHPATDRESALFLHESPAFVSANFYKRVTDAARGLRIWAPYVLSDEDVFATNWEVYDEKG